MGRIVGIDLGTTNSVVAVLEGGQPTVIPSAEGHRTVPSVVAYRKSGERLVGLLAKRQAVVNPTNTVSSAKRLMGRRFDDPYTLEWAEVLPYAVVAALANAGVAIELADGRSFLPPEIAAVIIAKLKADAERYLGEPVTDAVITVPAYFNDAQRQATAEAGRIAGLNVRRIINEPTAAALAYGFGRARADTNLVVYDLGGGTFDVSVLHLSSDVFEVLATSGDTRLGGDDFDQSILEWLKAGFAAEHGIDLASDPMAMQRLRDAAETARIELSSVTESEIHLPFLTADATGPKHLSTTLTRTKLEQLIGEAIDRTRQPVIDAIAAAGLTADEIDEVVLVGGATRTPLVVDLVRQLFDGREPTRGISPDEAVALGAAVQAGILDEDIRDLIVLDMTPLSLGIELIGDRMSVLIERNSTIPTTRADRYTTVEDRQRHIAINVYQGENQSILENEYMAGFVFGPLRPAPAGVPSIEIRFSLDANGMLNVEALERSTGLTQGISIHGSTRLTPSEIEPLQRRLESGS